MSDKISINDIRVDQGIFTVEDARNAAEQIFTLQESDFNKIKNAKWYQNFVRAITFGTGDKKYILNNIRSLGMLQTLFIQIYVKQYSVLDGQLRGIIENQAKTNQIIGSLLYSCVEKIRPQENLKKLSEHDKQILMLFLAAYQSQNGKDAEFRAYRSDIASTCSATLPQGDFEPEQLSRVAAAEVFYRCALELAAIDESLDSLDIPEVIYEAFDYLNISQASKKRVESEVHREIDVFGSSFLTRKYGSHASDIDMADLDLVASEKQSQVKRIQADDASLIIVCAKDAEKYGSYLMQLISQEGNENTPNIYAGVDVVLWNEKEYEDERRNITSRQHVLFFGNSSLIKNESAKMQTDFKKYGLFTASLGTKAVVSVQSELSLKESKSFEDFCKSYSKSYVGKTGFGGATALIGAGLGILSVLLGPVGWAGVALGALAGGGIGGALGMGADRKSSKDDQYSFLTFYCYTDFLPRFLGLDIPEIVSTDAASTANEATDGMDTLASEDDESAFLMPIDGVFTISGRGTCVTGIIASGSMAVGDEVEIVAPDGTKRKTSIMAIEQFHKLLDQANEGDSVGVLLRGVSKKDVEAGYILTAPRC